MPSFTLNKTKAKKGPRVAFPVGTAAAGRSGSGGQTKRVVAVVKKSTSVLNRCVRTPLAMRFWEFVLLLSGAKENALSLPPRF